MIARDQELLDDRVEVFDSKGLDEMASEAGLVAALHTLRLTQAPQGPINGIAGHKRARISRATAAAGRGSWMDQRHPRPTWERSTAPAAKSPCPLRYPVSRAPGARTVFSVFRSRPT